MLSSLAFISASELVESRLNAWIQRRIVYVLMSDSQLSQHDFTLWINTLNSLWMRSLCWQCKRRKSVPNKRNMRILRFVCRFPFEKDTQYHQEKCPQTFVRHSFSSCSCFGDYFGFCFLFLFDVTTNILRMYICSLWFTLIHTIFDMHNYFELFFPSFCLLTMLIQRAYLIYSDINF